MASFLLATRIVQIVLLIEAVASLSTPSTTATESASRERIAAPLPQIPTIPASDFDPSVQYYHTIERRDGSFLAYETPVIVQGVLSEEACEKLTDDLVSECGRIEVTLQRKRRAENTPSSPTKSKAERRRKTKKKNDGKSKEKSDTPGRQPTASTTTDLYLCSFLEAIDLVLGQSKHDDTLLAFCEGLLDSPLDSDEISDAQSSQLSLQHKMETAREELFQQRMNENSESSTSDVAGESVASHPIDPCWFREYFPAEALPTDCVILAGEGATSTLHRDPLEWTGTNLCVDGTKVWRFVAPPLAVAAVTGVQDEGPIDELDDDENNSSVSVVDGLLDAYRLDSIAWGNSEDDPLTLSAGWQSDYSLFADFRDPISGKDLLKLEEKAGTKGKLDTMTKVASDVDRLRPDIPVGVVGAATNKDGVSSPEECVTVWSGVQKPGDMIVIPAHWWHQTYAMEASLAIASQRCGAERDSERVFRHILETTATQESVATESTTFNKGQEDPAKILSLLRSKASSPQETVDRLFDYLASLREDRSKQAK